MHVCMHVHMYLILLVCAGLRALSQESSSRQYAGAETMGNMLFLRVREMRAYGIILV